MYQLRTVTETGLLVSLLTSLQPADLVALHGRGRVHVSQLCLQGVAQGGHAEFRFFFFLAHVYFS